MCGLTLVPAVTTFARTVSVLPIQRVTAATAIAEGLREELLSGALPPGTALHDVELAGGAGVPLPTVREALAELARDGLVVHSLTRGMEVARITPPDVGDIYGARRTFEAAGLTALLTSAPVDVSWLRAATERMGEAAVAADGRAVVEADMAFHLALVAAAGVRRLTRAARGALMELRLVLPVADRVSDDLPALVADHQLLVEIFEAGDLAASHEALQEHLDHGEGLARAAASIVAEQV